MEDGALRPKAVCPVRQGWRYHSAELFIPVDEKKLTGPWSKKPRGFMLHLQHQLIQRAK